MRNAYCVLALTQYAVRITFDSPPSFCDNRFMRLNGPGGRSEVSRYIAIALIAYGALGVAIQLRLLPLAVAGLTAWLGLPAATDMPTRWGVLDLLQAHYDGLPWLPWAAWLLGAGL